MLNRLKNNRGFALGAVVTSLFLLSSVVVLGTKATDAVRGAQRYFNSSGVKSNMSVVRDFLIQDSTTSVSAGGMTYYVLRKEGAGNTIPAAIPIGANDSYGIPYKYCTWDISGTNANPLYSQNLYNPPASPSTAGQIGRIISGGADRTVQTSCVDTIAQGDDVVLDINSSSSTTANGGMGGWKDAGSYLLQLNPAAYVGIGLTTPPTHRVEMPAGTTAAEGLAMGDVELFRSAANTLQANVPGGALNVSGGTIQISGNSVIDSSRNILGNDVSAAGTLSITGNTTLTGALVANGGTGTTTLSTSGLATLDSAAVTNNASIGGTFSVTGNTTLTGALAANGGTSTTTLSTSGLATLNSATVTNNASVGGTLTVTGLVNLTAGNLQMGGVDVINASRNLVGLNAVAQNLTPLANNTYSIGGGAGSQYLNIYAQNIYQNGNKVLDSNVLSGTANTLAKFTSPTTVGDSIIFDDGTNIAINSAVQAGNTLYIKGATSDNTTNALNVANNAGTSILVAKNNGNLLVGSAVETAGAEKLQVAGSASITGWLKMSGSAPTIHNTGVADRLLLTGSVTGAATGGGSIALREATAAVNPSGLELYAGGAERLRIVSSGNVLVGTTADDGYSKLQVNGNITQATNTGLFQNIYYSGSAWKYGTTSHGTGIYASSGNLRLSTFGQGVAGADATEKVNLVATQTGNILIGTTTEFGGANYQLQSDRSFDGANGIFFRNTNVGASVSARLILGNAFNNTHLVMYGTGHANAGMFNLYNDGGTIMFSPGGSEKMRATGGGNFLIGATTETFATERLQVQGGAIVGYTDENTTVGGNTVAKLAIRNQAPGGYGRMSEIHFHSGGSSPTTMLSSISSGYRTYNATNGTGGDLMFSTKDAAVTNSVQERMRITGSGNLLLGNTADNGTNSKLQIFGGLTSTFTNYGTTLLQATADGQTVLSHTSKTDVAGMIDMSVIGPSGPTVAATGSANIRLFRSTNTTGGVQLQIFKGDNTASANSVLGGNSNSYLNALTGNVFVGATADDGTLSKLQVAGSLSLTGNTYYSAASYEIKSYTNDGTDNKRVLVEGGGAASNTRGAYLQVTGNEYAGLPGTFIASVANIATAYGEISGGAASGRLRLNGDTGNVLIGSITESTGAERLQVTGAIKSTDDMVVAGEYKFRSGTTGGATAFSSELRATSWGQGADWSINATHPVGVDPLANMTYTVDPGLYSTGAGMLRFDGNNKTWKFLAAPTSTGVGTAAAMSNIITLGSTGVSSSVNFSAPSITSTGLTASKVVFTDGSKALTSTGTVGADQGGTGQSVYTIGDLLQASTTTALSKLAAVGTGNVLLSGGVGTVSAWGKVGLTTHVSGTLGVGNGGTGLASTPTNGQLLIGNGTNYTLAGLTGTANQVTVTNGAGTITLSLPQDIATTSTPTFAGLKITANGTLAWAPTAARVITFPDVTGTVITTGNLSSITATGTISSGTWNGTAIGATYGGTGQTVYAVGDLLYANTTTTLAKLADVATGNSLISGGVGVAPAWGKIGLTTHISGTLGIGNGGTGQTTATAAFDALSPATTLGDLIYHNGTDNVRLAGNITASKMFLSQTGNGAASATPVWAALAQADISGLTTASTPQFAGLKITANGTLAWAPSAARVITFPDVTGTVITTGNLSSITATGTISSGTWNGTAIGATYGGTGQTAYTVGDLLYANSTTTLAKLAGNITTTKMFLSQTGNGAASAAPVWAALTQADISGLTTTSTPQFAGLKITANGTLAWAPSAARVITFPDVTGTVITTGNLSAITATGTISSGTWNGTAIGATYGGTGQTVYAVGDLLYANTTTTLAKLADVATGNSLISGGIGVAPAWGKIGLTTHISGTLGIGNGGTGQTTATAAFDALSPATTLGDLIYHNGTDNVRLPGNITITKMFLAQTGNGAASAAPGWSSLSITDIADSPFKGTVRAATTANIALTGTQTIDGIALIAGDRVLVKNQTTASQNGIYVVAAGAWSRSNDANTTAELSGAAVSVTSGTQKGVLFSSDFAATDVLGTNSMNWYGNGVYN